MNIRNIIGGFVEVANGLASILTLGCFAPGWDFRYYSWLTRRDIEKQLEQQEASNDWSHKHPRRHERRHAQAREESND